MSRIPYPDMSTVPADRLERINYPKFEPLNITRVALHLPDGLWEAHFELKNALVKKTTIDDKLREVLILRIGHLAKCDYILNHHISISANLGFSPEKQDAIRDEDYAQLSEQERAIAEFTDSVVREVKASDELVARMRALFGDPLLCEIIVLIYSYWGTAMFIGVTGVDPEAEAIKSWDWTAEDAK